MKRILLFFLTLFCLLALFLPVMAQAPALPYSVELGTGHLLIPNSGNYVAAGWETQWQLKAAFQLPLTKGLALKIIYSQDTLKPQEWALEHAFTTMQPYGFKYNLWDAEVAFPSLFKAGNKWSVTPGLGVSLLHMMGHEMPGYFAALDVRYAIAKGFFVGGGLKYRYFPSVPSVGVANCGEASLIAGYAF
jgi:hypothetical protein